MNSSTHWEKKSVVSGLVAGLGLLLVVPVALALADTTPPAQPTGLLASVVSSSEIDLSWAASSDDVGVTGYDILRNGAQVSTTSSMSYADTGLTAGTNYWYAVEAYDAAGNLSTQSPSVSATTLGDSAAPSVPSGLVATAVSSSQVNLSWSASSDNIGVTGYDVYRNGSEIATTTATSYSDSGLSASTGYSYTVAAYDAAGNVSSRSTSASATTLASGSSAPTISLVVPPTIDIGANGNILVHGLTITSVGTNTVTGTIWGITYTVNYSSSTTGGKGFQFFLKGGNSASFDPSQLQVGDVLGVQGSVSQSAPSVIQAQIVRNYSISTLRTGKKAQSFGSSGNGAGNEESIGSLQALLQQLLAQFQSFKGDVHGQMKLSH